MNRTANHSLYCDDNLRNLIIFEIFLVSFIFLRVLLRIKDSRFQNTRKGDEEIDEVSSLQDNIKRDIQVDEVTSTIAEEEAQANGVAQTRNSIEKETQADVVVHTPESNEEDTQAYVVTHTPDSYEEETQAYVAVHTTDSNEKEINEVTTAEEITHEVHSPEGSTSNTERSLLENITQAVQSLNEVIQRLQCIMHLITSFITSQQPKSDFLEFPVTKNDVGEKIELKSGLGAYERIVQEFRRGFHANEQPYVHVFKVYQIRNFYLLEMFYAYKEKVLSETAGDINSVQWLWHGTDYESAQKIFKSEFNRSYAGKHGCSYGKGVYFATNCHNPLSYSANGKKDLKSIIYAYVATGRYMQGSSSIDRTNLPSEFHSTVNNILEPSHFVVYHDAAAYPAYEVQYLDFRFKRRG